MEIHIAGTPKEINEFMDLRFKGNKVIKVSSGIVNEDIHDKITAVLEENLKEPRRSPWK